MTTNRAWSYVQWHNGPDCSTRCFVDNGSGNLWLECEFHKVVAQLEAVAKRVSWQESEALTAVSLVEILNARELDHVDDPG